MREKIRKQGGEVGEREIKAEMERPSGRCVRERGNTLKGTRERGSKRNGMREKGGGNKGERWGKDKSWNKTDRQGRSTKEKIRESEAIKKQGRDMVKGKGEVKQKWMRERVRAI